MTDPGSTYRLIDLPGQGPEDVVVDGNGFVLTGLNDGRILRVDADTGRVEVLVLAVGRPLGWWVGGGAACGVGWVFSRAPAAPPPPPRRAPFPPPPAPAAPGARVQQDR